MSEKKINIVNDGSVITVAVATAAKSMNYALDLKSERGEGACGHNNIGLLWCRGESSLVDSLLRMICDGASRFVVMSPNGKELSSIEFCSNRLKSSLKKRCRFVSDNLVDILVALRTFDLEENIYSERETTFARELQARKLYLNLETFGHGKDLDITNRFLGPVRMLLLANRIDIMGVDGKYGRAWRKQALEVVEEFRRGIVDKILEQGALYGGLGRETVELFKKVERILTEENLHSGTKNVEVDLKRLMLLLTECREIGQGRASKGDEFLRRKVDPVDPLMTGDSFDSVAFRILVVDDHAAAWKPVFEVVQQELAEQWDMTVMFEFSADAKTVLTVEQKVRELFSFVAEYDLIILDVFLGESNGLDLLDKIRESFMWIPVIVWTTARQLEITAAAALSNGFLFKKTATCGDVVAVIGRWLAQGYSRRTTSLPGRLFDENIETNKYRVCAGDFTSSCLRTLDGFHAIDDSYFRTFNDHGGRHVHGLLKLLENLLAGFVLGDSGLFAHDRMEKEQELVSLYLAVMCHELGMFPFERRKGGREDFGNVDVERRRAIRKVHAVRSMVLLVCDEFELGEIRSLIKALGKADPSGYIETLLGLIAGYHSRLLSFDSFLEIDDVREEKLRVTFETASISVVRPADVRQALNKLKISMQRLGGSRYNEVVVRAKKICALFRFADAIDIDRSRLPADFLVFDMGRSALDDRENFKKQIVRFVRIGGSAIVNMGVDALPPDARKVKKIVECCRTESAKNINQSIIDNPWNPEARDVVCDVQSILDEWLELYWLKIVRRRKQQAERRGEDSLKDGSSEEQRTTERYEELCSRFKETATRTVKSGRRDCDVRTPTEDVVSPETRHLVAGVTGLSIAGEVLDEYKAIRAVKLDEQVKLGEVQWKREREWNMRDLTILKWDR